MAEAVGARAVSGPAGPARDGVPDRDRDRPRRGGAALAWTVAPYVVVLLGWALLVGGNRWYVNPDGVVYAGLARSLAAGHPGAAVTGYWSPLLPALAAPLVALGVPALTALRLVLLAAALVAVPVLADLGRRAGAGRRAADLGALLAAPLLLAGSLFGLYPELLLATLLLLHVRAVLVATTLRGALLAALWGALAYLAKAVGLPFVLGFVVLVTAVRLVRRGGRRRGLVTGATALGATVLLAAPWAAAVSVGAGYPTISTAAAFNASLVAPGVRGNPLSFPGLYRPAPGSDTPWTHPEDLPIPRVGDSGAGAGAGAGAAGTGTGTARPATVTTRVANAARQARVGVGALVRRWWLVTPLAVAGLVAALRRRGPGAGVAAGLALAAVLFAGGMSLIIVVERYLWFPMLATVPLAAVALDAVGSRRPRLLAVAGPVAAAAVAVSLAPVVTLHRGEDREVWALARRLSVTAPLSGPVAGNRDWGRSQLLAYLSGVDYVGLTGQTGGPGALAARLREVGATGLVVWPAPPTGLAASSGAGSAVVYRVTADGLAVRGEQ